VHNTTRRPRLRALRRAHTTLAALIATAALTGCAGLGNPGMAAQVGDETITVSFLQEQVGEALEHDAQSSGGADRSVSYVSLNQRSLLQQMIHDRLIVLTADRLGVSASEAEVEAVKDEFRQQGQYLPPDMVDEVARFVALRRSLNTRLLGKTPRNQQEQSEADQRLVEEMRTVARDVGVTVNPRYGRWNGIQLVPGGQLVEPISTGDGQLQQVP